MKTWKTCRLLLLTLVLSLVLCACGDNTPAASGESPDEESPATEEPAEQPAAPEADPAPEAPAEPAPAREKTTQLTYFLEGEEEVGEAVLYQCEGYSIYMPAEWMEKREGEPDTWVCVDNEDLAIQVLPLGETKDAQADVQAHFPDYELDPEEDHRIYGEKDRDQGMAMGCLKVFLFETENGVYAVSGQYPLEATEGFGDRFPVIARTFQMDPSR